MSATFSETGYTPEFQPVYEMSDNEVLGLSARLLSERPSGLADRFVAYELDGTDPFSNLGRIVESDVFDEAFDDKIDDMEEAYGPYEAASSFFLVMDQDAKRPVGALRIIRNSEAGLKTLNDISGEPLNISTESVKEFHGIDSLDNCWDVGTVAVLPQYRTTAIKSSLSRTPQPNIMLYRSLYAKARYEGIDHFVAIIDDKALNGLNLLGVPFVPVNDSGKFPFMGSKSSNALYGFVPEFYDKMDARFERIKENHPVRAKFLARPLGQLMLGEDTDHKLFLNYS